MLPQFLQETAMKIFPTRVDVDFKGLDGVMLMRADNLGQGVQPDSLPWVCEDGCVPSSP